MWGRGPRAAIGRAPGGAPATQWSAVPTPLGGARSAAPASVTATTATTTVTGLSGRRSEHRVEHDTSEVVRRDIPPLCGETLDLCQGRRSTRRIGTRPHIEHGTARINLYPTTPLELTAHLSTRPLHPRLHTRERQAFDRRSPLLRDTLDRCQLQRTAIRLLQSLNERLQTGKQLSHGRTLVFIGGDVGLARSDTGRIHIARAHATPPRAT
jgi:hypothetical protein